MKQFVCKVCGYVHEGESAPERCPICAVPAEKFEEIKPEVNNKYVCPICGYVHEGESAPEKCPICKLAGEKFEEI